MTNPKNTGDQELSLDQLKDAAGGLIGAVQSTGMKTTGTFDLKENLDTGDHHDVRKDNLGNTSGPGGSTFPKDRIGTTKPGSDVI